MSDEVKIKYAGMGAVLGLVAGMCLGVWLASGWVGGIRQNITALLFISILGLGVGGGVGWFIGATIRSPVVGMRLFIVAGLPMLFTVLQLLVDLPWVVDLIITGAAGILLWWINQMARSR